MEELDDYDELGIMFEIDFIRADRERYRITIYNKSMGPNNFTDRYLYRWWNGDSNVKVRPIEAKDIEGEIDRELARLIDVHGLITMGLRVDVVKRQCPLDRRYAMNVWRMEDFSQWKEEILDYVRVIHRKYNRVPRVKSARNCLSDV